MQNGVKLKVSINIHQPKENPWSVNSLSVAFQFPYNKVNRRKISCVVNPIKPFPTFPVLELSCIKSTDA
uniref:Ovule protein n=1 Tax=Romanomermis culicivorax TaxID=13658 RepID=A0A915IXK0_ROMCU